MKVLILEDDLVDQMALSRSFNKKIPAAKITICNNISAALELLNNENFDWIISDFNLPDGTIQDILPFARKNKMICVSGELDNEKLKEFKIAGLFKYLIKDQHLNYLEAIINDIQNHDSNIIPDLNEINTNKIERSLKKHFENDIQTKREILEIFTSRTLEKDLPDLLSAINIKDEQKVKYLAHKIQSSFRLFNASEVLIMLLQLEDDIQMRPIPWEKMKFMSKDLEIERDCYSKRAHQILNKLNQHAG